MQAYETKRQWQKWITLRRIIPLVTILAASVVGVLATLGYFQATPIEGALLSVMALLSVDALTERIDIMEKIENRLTNLTSVSGLKSRSELPSFKECGQNASEIFLGGVSLLTAVAPNLSFFEQKMRSGCKLRFLLLDPVSPSLQVWHLMNKVSNAEADIEVCLNNLTVLVQLEKTTKGKCEVRLSNVFLPFSFASFDPNKSTGFMTIEHGTYKRPYGERPHIQLSKTGNEMWFNFYKSQYEQLWTESRKWPSPD